MKVYWTLEARARLLEIHTYIARESPMVARDVTARILRRSRQLATPPLLGRRLPEYPNADLVSYSSARSESSTQSSPTELRSLRSSTTGRTCLAIRGIYYRNETCDA